jgi:aminoglycoside/choline kinase family phosphotransferase
VPVQEITKDFIPFMDSSEQEHLGDLYRRHFSSKPEDIQPLKGDGSDRRYYRLTGNPRVIGVAGSNSAENKAFVYFSERFAEQGLPVPAIYNHDLSRGIYLEEDLGDRMLCDEAADPNIPMDRKIRLCQHALYWLPQFQITAGRSLDFSHCYQYNTFARDSMMWDLDYFRVRFLDVFMNPSDHDEINRDFVRLVDHLLEEENEYFLYRDFQSRNIMVQGDRVRFIDYQSGRRGSLQYDVASLLYDANMPLTESMREALLYYYMEQVNGLLKSHFDAAKFLKYYHGFALIRLLQALGAFGFLSMVKGKKYFLKSIPAALDNLEIILGKSEILRSTPVLRDVLHGLVNDEKLRAF